MTIHGQRDVPAFTKWIPCPNCKGIGIQPCKSCNGKKWKREINGYSMIVCPVCNGAGKQACEVCKGEKKMPTYDQDGRWDKK